MWRPRGTCGWTRCSSGSLPTKRILRSAELRSLGIGACTFVASRPGGLAVAGAEKTALLPAIWVLAPAQCAQGSPWDLARARPAAAPLCPARVTVLGINQSWESPHPRDMPGLQMNTVPLKKTLAYFVTRRPVGWKYSFLAGSYRRIVGLGS